MDGFHFSQRWSQREENAETNFMIAIDLICYHDVIAEPVMIYRENAVIRKNRGSSKLR